MNKALLIGVMVLGAAPLSAQTAAPTMAGLVQAFAHYDSVFRAQDPAAIAACFAPDGRLGSVRTPPVIGPDSIAARLRQFAAYKLLASTLTADSTRILGDTGLQVGRFWQRVRLPSGDTVEAHGTFSAAWIWHANAGWRIAHLYTDP